MIEGVSLHNPVFVNTVGHTFGVLLFGLLSLLFLRGWDKARDRQRAASLAAALLAFLWNFGSLLGLGFTQENGAVANWVVAVNFSALSLLPAVLLSVVLKGRYPLLARLGYLIGFFSVILHFAELQFPSEPLHETALLLVTAGFGGLVLILVLLPSRRSEGMISLTDIVCLVLFALSFLHFGYGHSTTAWTNEVAWHHAGIPLALIVLLRDYRLLLLETFVRFIANAGLAGLYVFALYWVNHSEHIATRARGNGFATALLLIALCCSLVLFAVIRTFVQKELTRVVFRRGDLNLSMKQILQVASDSQTEKELLDRAASHIARFIEAERFSVVERSGLRRETVPALSWVETELSLRFSRGDSLTLLLGRRRGSGRYLAEDLSALNHLSSLLVEQVERFRANELQRLAHEAELRALQAQINPHFLFNALNTLYGTIGRESFEARRLVLNLAELFRYCLQRDRTLIPLGEELQIVQAYLEIESLRLRDRLSFELVVSDEARNVMIPVLSVQPLVENAVKHGVSKMSKRGQIRVLASKSDGQLTISVHDNGPGFEPASGNSGMGIGLENVRQRLHLCFGESANLTIKADRQGCSAVLSLPLQQNGGGGSSIDENRSYSSPIRSSVNRTPA